MRLWGGRFEGQPNEHMERFNASIGFDWRLYEADIEGSAAYAEALADAGLLTTDERDAIQRGLGQILEEFEQGRFDLRLSDEDIHTAVERRLHELIGPVAGKLHTGRSRNDQVATDLRIYARMAIRRLDEALVELQRALIAQAERYRDALMPGYTHLQRAQPVPVAHWLLAHFWPLQRDRERLQDCRRRLNLLPLGAGALAGNALGINRELLARTLGFDGVTPNSMDAVSDRDFVAELLFCGALIGVHLSRLAEDLIIYSTAEFGFVRLSDAYSTGSSLMPQKRNPDSMELTRGKAGRLIGHLLGLLTVLKGLPSTYNKDLQEDKEPLFDTIDTLLLMLPVVSGAIASLTIDTARTQAALDDAMLATDIADELVRLGVPFREAHHQVGALVKAAEQRGVALRALPPELVRDVHPALAERWAGLFDARRSVEQRRVTGATAAAALQAQLEAARACLE
ncbi:argininosuccinate lyase [Kallotenue papyrolyticum]|uniref:argininosuccinate lyase n=1 Tax=Kallotenue papyrolyticum TaxID=1325125 RepID=UPI0004B0AE4D|nr:argininosuccinate lyase [Kallotenue papyrolyticum]